MKLLIVSDEESRKIWEYYEPGMLDAYDLILSCGDLDSDYLQFLCTMSKAPVLYVHGNHDYRYEKKPPEGCISVEDTVYNFRGLRILGLGGSYKYGDKKTMFTESEMHRRARRVKRKIMRSGGFDLLLTHAPAKGFHDGSDFAHQGFRTFLDLMDTYHPRYFVHGHVHKAYSDGYRREDRYGDTTVINAWGTYVLDIPDELLADRKMPSRKQREGTVLYHKD